MRAATTLLNTYRKQLLISTMGDLIYTCASKMNTTAAEVVDIISSDNVDTVNIWCHTKHLTLKALNTYSHKEAAHELGISERCLHRYRKEFHIECKETEGRKVYYFSK